MLFEYEVVYVVSRHERREDGLACSLPVRPSSPLAMYTESNRKMKEVSMITTQFVEVIIYCPTMFISSERV